MLKNFFPESDETPWGLDENWDSEYVEQLADRWSSGIKEAHFLIDATDIAPGGRVLDIGCGAGRHALTFSKAGLEVVGVDINSHAIEKAREICLIKKLQGQFVHLDFRKLPYKNEFDLAVLLDNTFGILCEEENRWLLTGAARTLRMEGLLVIDVYNREYVVDRIGHHKGLGRRWEEKEGTLSSSASFFDLMRSRFNRRREYMVLKTGKKVKEPISSIRLYSLCELAALLEKAGLEILRVFGDFNGSEYVITSERMIVTARKVKKK